MGKKRIRIAVIGCGNIARRAHMGAYNELDDFELVAACDIVEERAKSFAETFRVPQYFTDYRDVLALEGLDAVDICTPNYLHSTIAVEALERGLHVICEKPDAISVEKAMEMKAAADRNGKTLMVIRNNRFNPASIFLKRYIDEENGLGKIYAARCGWQRRRGVPGRGGWFTTKAQSGGGPLIDLGVHMIDLTMWLMGNPKPVSVSGCTYSEFSDNATSDGKHTKFVDKKGEGTFDVEDLAMGFIRFDNGACLQLEFSWASNIEKDHKFFELRGNKAGAEWNQTDNQLRIYTEQFGKTADYLPNLPTKYSGHLENLRNFAAVLRGEAEPVFRPEQGIDMIKILCAIYESAETGKEVLL